MCHYPEDFMYSQLSRGSFFRLGLLFFLTAAFAIPSGETGRPPRILEHPADSVVPRNEPATLNCKADGDPTPTITWLKDGKSIRPDARRLLSMLPSGSLFFLRVRKDQDAGVYACVAENTFGEVTSRNGTLDVATLRDEFRASPQNTWVAQGDTAVLECEPPRGNPEPKVLWKRNGHPIDVKANGRYRILGLGSLSISQVRQSDEGRYLCTAKNIVGMRQSNTALLRVTVRPQFTIVPANTSALLGSDVSLACVARGDPPPEITWKKQRGTLPLKRAHFDEERFLISNVSEQDAGVYTCVAENKAGSIVSSASVTVLALPAFSVTPQNVEIQPNATAYFGCETVGEPKPTLFWSREGSHSVIFQGSALENARVTPEGTLQIDNVSERDEGYYFCAAVSPAGSVMSRVHLKVTPVEDLPPPIINVGPSNQTRPVGSVAVMPCIADGNPPPVITWYKNSNSFMLNHRIFTDDAGTLRINELSKDDSGLYECVASSRSGKYVWRAYLQVESSTNPTVNFRRNGFDMGNLRPKEPMKPHIVKVDSTSVTIAWHPKYFQFFEPERSAGDSNRFLVESDHHHHHESGSPGISSNSNTGSSSNIRSELNRNSHNGQEGHSSSFVQESINIKKAKEAKSFLDESDEEEDDDEEDDDIMLDDQPMPFLPEWSADKETKIGSDNEDDTRNDFLEQSDTLPNSRQKESTDSSFLRNHRDRSISFSLSPSTTPSPLTRPRLLSRRRRQQPGGSVQKQNKDKNNRYEQKPSNDAASSFLNEPLRSRNVFNVDDANVESDEGGFTGGFEDEDEYREEKQSFDDVIDQITKQERERENEEFDVDEDVNVENHSSSSSNVNSNNNLIIQSTKSNSRFSSSTTTNAPLTTTTSISQEMSTATTTSASFASALTSPRASAPVNVLSKTNTNDAINVKNPHSSNANNQNPLTYKVEYYSSSEEKSEWLLGATNVPLEVFTLQYLKPNTEYIFFVRSVSQEGIISIPSPLSTSVTTLMSGSRNSDLDLAREKFGSGIVVLLKNAYPTSSTTSRIEWQVVNAGDFIEGFYIYYRQMEQKDDGSYQMLTVLNAGASTFQIVGLEKYTTYQIFLLPFYKNVDGRPSNYINVTTLQDVPTAAPELLEPIPVNSSALIVHWKSPPVRHQNGVIMGYQLRVWSGSALVGNRTVNGSTVSLLLNNLTPGKSYSLQIGSFTAKGVGVFSSMKTLHFRPENPSPDNNSIDNNNKMSNSVHSQPSDNNYKGKVGNGGSKPAGNNNKSNKINGKTYDGNNINFGSGSLGVSQGGNGIRGNGDGSDEEYDGLSTTKNDGVAYGGTVAHHDFFTEAWFVALIGSVIFVMMLVFVFALYMRRCQLRKDGDKLKVSTTEIPDGSIPPHYQEDNLWIDSQQKQLSLKSVKTNDLNEYENANNYAVVEDRHSPIPYATTTLINGEKHKSNFSVFGDSTKAMNGHGGSRPGDFGMMASPKMVGWASAAVPQNNKTGSLNICSQDMKKLPWLSTTPAAPSTPCPSQSHSKVNLKPKLKLKSKGKERLRSKRENFGGGKDTDDDDDDVTESFCLNSQDLGKGASLNVLTTFQTPLPTRKHLIVDFSNGQSVTSSILQYHEPRLIVGSHTNGSSSTASTTVNSSNHNNYSHNSHNSHNGYAHSHSHSHNHNGHNVNHNAF